MSYLIKLEGFFDNVVENSKTKHFGAAGEIFYKKLQYHEFL